MPEFTRRLYTITFPLRMKREQKQLIKEAVEYLNESEKIPPGAHFSLNSWCVDILVRAAKQVLKEKEEEERAGRPQGGN